VIDHDYLRHLREALGEIAQPEIRLSTRMNPRQMAVLPANSMSVGSPRVVLLHPRYRRLLERAGYTITSDNSLTNAQRRLLNKQRAIRRHRARKAQR
jgi:hypothetical protein